MIRLVNYEGHKTYSYHYAEIVFKLTLAYFVNYAIVVLLTNKIVRKDNDWSIFGSAGVVGNMLVLMIISVISDSLWFIFDPIYLYKLYKRSRLLATID